MRTPCVGTFDTRLPLDLGCGGGGGKLSFLYSPELPIHDGTWADLASPLPINGAAALPYMPFSVLRRYPYILSAAPQSAVESKGETGVTGRDMEEEHEETVETVFDGEEMVQRCPKL